MFLKKSSHKSKHKKPSCLFYCFGADHSFIVHDSGVSDVPPAAVVASTDSTNRRSTCFSWLSIRRKKESPKSQVDIPKSVPSFEAAITNESKKKVKRCWSLPAERLESAGGDGEANFEFQHPLLPQHSPKYDTRGRIELPTPPRVDSPARTKKGKKLGPTAGLTVIGVTLAVTVFYGRTAAVVSLCACLYLVACLGQPPLSGELKEKMSGSNDADVGSKEYKKRVVMEGFLERNKKRKNF